MNSRLPLLMAGVVGAGVGLALSSCNFHPPSKPWKQFIDRDLLIEEIECSPEIPGPVGPNGPHCHLVVKKSAGGEPEPTRHLRITKPFGRNYTVTITTVADGKSTEADSGMSCEGLQEFGSGYELNGYCRMNSEASSKTYPHEHVFRAWVQPAVNDGTKRWVRFEFIHDKLGPRHNGTGHTQAE